MENRYITKSKCAPTITMNADAFRSLLRLKDELDSVIESVELMNDPEFMRSYQRAKEEIRNRDFDDWDELTKGL